MSSRPWPDLGRSLLMASRIPSLREGVRFHNGREVTQKILFIRSPVSLIPKQNRALPIFFQNPWSQRFDRTKDKRSKELLAQDKYTLTIMLY